MRNECLYIILRDSGRREAAPITKGDCIYVNIKS